MPGQVEDINPDILTWAREQAGLSLEEAARVLRFRDTKRERADEKLRAFEDGTKFPTQKQLQDIAKLYHRPVITFYLSKPPEIANRGVDFRRLSEQPTPRENALLDALLRDARARQAMVKSILEDDEDTKPLTFIESMDIDIDTPIVQAAKTVQDFLHIDDLAQFREKTADKKFKVLRERIQAQGIFVVKIGNLGSYHTDIDAKIFRGFVISDTVAPLIVINPKDAKTAQPFTLIHELVHLFLGSTGISGAPYAESTESTPATRTEEFCNTVASEFLLPAESLKPFKHIESFEQADETIRDIAKQYKVSEYLVAYRFLKSDKIDKKIYDQLRANYSERWQKQKEVQREKNKGGPNALVIRRAYLGDSLLGLVSRTLKEGKLTYTRAAKILGVNATSVAATLSAGEAANRIDSKNGGL